MNRLIVLILLLCPIQLMAQVYSISGKVLEAQNEEPVAFAGVVIEGSSVSTVTNGDGYFRLQHLTPGTYKLQIRCLGYASQSITVRLTDQDISLLEARLPRKSLALDEVAVIAKRKANDATTTYSMDRTVLDHLQGTSVADAISLLPGEQTNQAPNLTAGQIITLRGASQEMGNPAFGTVIEMDGVRLSGNAQLRTGGQDVRNIGNSNIERIDVISGVPSVEYGDFTNGIVKIVSRKGVSPLTVDFSIRPQTQTYALSQGFKLWRHAGIVNLSYERARSVSDLASPYTSYIRNAFSVRYSHTLFTPRERQFSYDLGLNANVGGYNSEADPDAYKNDFHKVRDNAFRLHLDLCYRAHSPWLSELKWGGTFAYADNQDEEQVNRSASAQEPAIHTLTGGYQVASQYEDKPNAPILMLPTGYWDQYAAIDDKPMKYSAFVKARWSHRFRDLQSNLLVGGEWKGEQNLGHGLHYGDMRYTPTWRPYDFSQLPQMNNMAVYAEEDFMARFSRSHLQLKAGIRSDQTLLSGSAYSRVNSWSPRVNVRYHFAESTTGFLRGITLRTGWGKAVKLPSFQILYPQESYVDRLAFVSTSTHDNKAYYAYHTTVNKPLYNGALKWQYHTMREVGADLKFNGFDLSLNFFYNSMYRPYQTVHQYTPFDYSYTDQKVLEKCPIPVPDRRFQIDAQTGRVTVTDQSGSFPAMLLPAQTIEDFDMNTMYRNGSSSSRIGLEWVLDVHKLPAIHTSFRLDGKYYHYKGLDEQMAPYRAMHRMSNGQPYKFIGYYLGGNTNFNGFKSDLLNMNLTVVTHVPKIRMIFSLRFEGTFLNTRQNLSERKGADRSFVTGDANDFLPVEGAGSIYDGEHKVVTYPDYYVTRDAMDTPIPFREKYLWAAEHDQKLYNELSQLVVLGNYPYMYKEQRYSPYFSANLNVTKEIGKYLTLSFFANNFFYSMQKVKANHRNLYETLFDSGRISPFNYGLSIKIKL